jgi:hypothetical protein
MTAVVDRLAVTFTFNVLISCQAELLGLMHRFLELLNAHPARLAGPFPLHRPHPGPRRTHLRAAAGRLGPNVIKIDALLEDAGSEQLGGPRHDSDFQNLHCNNAR